MKFLFLFFAAILYGETLTLENNTSFDKVAIEWASSARAVQEKNEALMQQDPPAKELYYLRSSLSTVPIPSHAAYFRLLVFEAKEKYPHLLTNWVEIVPNKTYLLEKEHLTPVLLMNGMGC